MEEKGEYPIDFFFKEKTVIEKLAQYSIVFCDTLKAITTHVMKAT